jgi:transposase
MEWRLVERARIINKLLDGEQVQKVARDIETSQNTVIEWRDRFVTNGIKGLYDLPRSGKPPKYDKEFRNLVLKTLELPPPKGQSNWDGPSLSRHLGASDDAVWRVLRKEGICLARQRSWCVSTDPEFASKAADIVGLYLALPFTHKLALNINYSTGETLHT